MIPDIYGKPILNARLPECAQAVTNIESGVESGVAKFRRRCLVGIPNISFR